MQVVELADVILALLMEVLIDVIFAQSLKATSGEDGLAKPAQVWFRRAGYFEYNWVLKEV